MDNNRLLTKVDELDNYLKELKQIMPESFEEFKGIEKKRACERLLQISIKNLIDTCALIVTGLRLGLPAEEDDLFERLKKEGIISLLLKETLKKMKGLRNILVHEYGRIDDHIIYETLKSGLGDFASFRKEILIFIKQQK